ncbi:d657bd50-5801-4958-8e8f-dbf8fbb3b942 [Thermothielavioides terrestris]|uniref:D657bd50-5801-4958-8e8f-dbf8fbb3b942 n=1 Tax=Thermothielavioides terrestris TaxID=2587410 RepID=A0A446B822_9PEZI|nr:d657bd50-5801-4958-8e8f-dbf8fbb3b942 [Thermothielavioides terrestris]
MMWAVALAALAITLAWLVRVNSAMQSVPEEISRLSPRRWTRKELRDTYERLKQKPVDFAKLLPPRLGRRYVVVGGSGLVGGDIVLQLLQRGEAPESIRIVDFVPLNRRDMLEAAAGCDFVKADISSRASVEAAFFRPWPASVAKQPLTVFHTAAIVRPQERSLLLYHRLSPVNRDGARNVLEVAKAAGADVFIATSSASVSILPPKFWIWPWQSTPENYVQVASEKDFDAPLRPRHLFFSNYAFSKAEAERAVCAANQDGFRTGAIRPGNPIYGQKTDSVLGMVLRMGSIVSWIPHIIQNFVYSRNVALAHLQFEAALAQIDKPMPRCAGRTFNVTDPGPPIALADSYVAAQELSVTPVRVTYQRPIVLFLIAHVIEAWCLLLARLPFLTKLGLREPSGPIHMLQPSVFSVSIHTVVDDSQARKSVADGGFGYTPGCTTMEGMCEQIREWNREQQELGWRSAEGPAGKVAKAALTAKGVAA